MLRLARGYVDAWWSRVLSYRYDEFMCEAETLRPAPPDRLPWLFPVSRVWLAAFWYAFFPLCPGDGWPVE